MVEGAAETVAYTAAPVTRAARITVTPAGDPALPRRRARPGALDRQRRRRGLPRCDPRRRLARAVHATRGARRGDRRRCGFLGLRRRQGTDGRDGHPGRPRRGAHPPRVRAAGRPGPRRGRRAARAPRAGPHRPSARRDVGRGRVGDPLLRAPWLRSGAARGDRGPAAHLLGHPRPPGRALGGAGEVALADMEHRTHGRTGVHVSPLCLGAMMFGAWGETDHDESIRIIHRALDAGINFVDTADVYSRGESEEIVGKALAGGRRDNVVLATKFHGTMGDDPNEAGNSRRWIFKEVEASLKRLQTDWIDLYQVHRWDPWTDHDETLGALSDLVAQGKVRYIGSSTYPAAQIVKAQWVARDRGHQRFVCEQPPYSMLIRAVEADVLPTCREFGMGVISWSPLAGGWLSGKWRKGAGDLTSRRSAMLPQRYDLSLPGNQAKLEAADALAGLAEEAGISLIHMAIAFVLRHPAVTAAIIGPRTMDHLESQLGAADVGLDDALLDRIDQIAAPGTNVNSADTGWDNPALAPAGRRRVGEGR